MVQMLWVSVRGGRVVACLTALKDGVCCCGLPHFMPRFRITNQFYWFSVGNKGVCIRGVILFPTKNQQVIADAQSLLRHQWWVLVILFGPDGGNLDPSAS